jgi:hypothetical protein
MKSTRTAVLEVRCDARAMAALLLFYQKEGVAIRSKSELIANALDDFVELLSYGGYLEQIKDTAYAVSILESTFGRGSINNAGRGRLNQVKAIQLEHGIRPVLKTTKHKPIQMQLPIDIDIEEATALLEENLAQTEAALQEGLRLRPNAINEGGE